MTYHILNGDGLAEKFPDKKISGQRIVIREAFIEGPLSKDFSKEFWDRRAEFISSVYDADKEDYELQFLSQLQLMDSIKPEDEICLWFEDDLFCQVNMWFSVYYISLKTQPKFFRIFPKEDNVLWSGFGRTDKEDLVKCFEDRKEFTNADIELARKLWIAYVMNDQAEMQLLSSSGSICFRFLPEVINAHLERFIDGGNTGRPQQTLIDILNTGKDNFYEIFEEFSKKDGIYGFGDLQVYNMLKEMEIEFDDPPAL